jgi:outer membrane protein TolC
MKIMKRYIIISILILLSLLAKGQSELNEYLEIAAKNNIELKQAFNEYMASLERIPQVKTLPDPTIAFAYLTQAIETRMGPQEYKLGISQMFPWFGTLKAKGGAATEMAKAKYEVFLDIKATVFNKVKSIYYNLYYNNKAALITNENIRLLEIIDKLALIKLGDGLVSAVDKYRIEMEINDLKNSLTIINDHREVLYTKFNNLLNKDGQRNIHSPEVLWERDFIESKESLLDSIKQRNHRLLSIDMQIESLRYKQNLAKKMGMPNISIGAEYISVGTGEVNLPGDDAILLPKIGITLPIYRKKYKAMQKEAYYNELAKNEQKLNLRDMLENRFEETWSDYKNAKDKIKLYKVQTGIAKKTLSILKNSYAANNSKFEEYIRMERKLLKYSLALEKARIDKHIAIANIEYLKGN